MANNAIKEKEKTTFEVEISPPEDVKIVAFNDDKTPIDFVVALFYEVFELPMEEAEEKTMQIHLSGSALVKVCPYEQAETLVEASYAIIKAYGFPLSIKIEE